jgi:subtilase family serine protease
VTDGTKQVGLVTVATLAPGASRTVTVSWKTTKGTHTVTAAVDPADAVAESNEGDNKLQRTVTAR